MRPTAEHEQAALSHQHSANERFCSPLRNISGIGYSRWRGYDTILGDRRKHRKECPSASSGQALCRIMLGVGQVHAKLGWTGMQREGVGHAKRAYRRDRRHRAESPKSPESEKQDPPPRAAAPHEHVIAGDESCKSIFFGDERGGVGSRIDDRKGKVSTTTVPRKCDVHVLLRG